MSQRLGSGPVKVPWWEGSEYLQLSLQFEFDCDHHHGKKLMILFLYFVNLTLECEHSLHHWGEERGFQQLGPGLHLVAGGISRPVGREITRVSNIVYGLGTRGTTGVAISAALPGVMTCVGATAFKATLVVFKIFSFLGGKWSERWSLLLLLGVDHGVDGNGEGLDRCQEGASGVDSDVVDLHCHWIVGGSWGWGWGGVGVGGVRAHITHSTSKHALGSASGSETIDVVESFSLGTHFEKGDVGVGYLIGSQ